MIASIRIAFIWQLYKRRKLLRIRQRKTDERAALRVRMRRIRGKDATMGAVALKRFHRVRVAVIIFSAGSIITVSNSISKFNEWCVLTSGCVCSPVCCDFISIAGERSWRSRIQAHASCKAYSTMGSQVRVCLRLSCRSQDSGAPARIISLAELVL